METEKYTGLRETRDALMEALSDVVAGAAPEDLNELRAAMRSFRKARREGAGRARVLRHPMVAELLQSIEDGLCLAAMMEDDRDA